MAERLSTRSRRGFLGGTAAALATFGLTKSATAGSHSEYADEYRTVVNIVEAGADNTGSESITSTLEDVRGDHTLVYFPPGEYYMDREFRFTNFENFGVVGDDATLVPADYHTFGTSNTRLFRLGTSGRPGGRIRFENFEVDQTAPDTGIRVIDTYASERLDVRDVRIRGVHDSGTTGPGHFNLTNSSATGMVERFRAPDGGQWVDNTPHAGNRWRGPIGIAANNNQGTLTFRRCWLGAFPDNGLYAAGSTGKIIVSGGVYRNSNGASIRVGGSNSEIRYPTVEITETRSRDRSQRAIRLEHGDGMLVRGAAIRITSPHSANRAISVMGSTSNTTIERGSIEMTGDKINHGIVVSQHAGVTTIDGVDIRHNTAGGFPIWMEDTDSSERVHCRGVKITGESRADSGMRDAIRCERHNCRFSSCELDHTGADGVRRNGLVLTKDDNTVYRSEIHATHYPYIDLGSNNLVHYSDLESDRGSEAVRLYSSAEGPRLRYNTLENGINDGGASNVEDFRNTY